MRDYAGGEASWRRQDAVRFVEDRCAPVTLGDPPPGKSYDAYSGANRPVADHSGLGGAGTVGVDPSQMHMVALVGDSSLLDLCHYDMLYPTRMPRHRNTKNANEVSKLLTPWIRHANSLPATYWNTEITLKRDTVGWVVGSS